MHSDPLQRSRALATTARRRQALTPVWWTCCGQSRPSHACSSHQTSTPGPLSLVVAACVKDAPPSCWRCYSGARSRQRHDTRSVENGRSLDAGRRGWRPVASWWAESKYNRRGSAQRGSGGSGGQVCTLAQSRKGAWSGPLNKTTLSHSTQARHRCELARASTITGTPPEPPKRLR